MSKTLKEKGNKGKYINLGAVDFIKWLSNHRGGHAHELKACAARWLNQASIKQQALKELSDEIRQGKC
jgi:hypothetical protein